MFIDMHLWEATLNLDNTYVNIDDTDRSKEILHRVV